MRIRSLTAFEVPIALRKPIRHASHTRHHNDTLVIRCELTDGSVGWGEGLPRSYVTGESIGSVWRHLTSSDFRPLGESRLETAMSAVGALDGFSLACVEPDQGILARECFGNSVRCALELALLDAACRATECSLSDLLRELPESTGLLEAQDNVFYSGVVTSENGFRQWRSALRMRLFGFRAIKVKVGAVGVDDRACLKRVRSMLGKKVDLRLDANEAWHCDQIEAKVRSLEEFGPTCIEQPVPHAEISGLADVRQRISMPIMLDESLCSLADAHRAIDSGTCDLFNLRISKCGGIVNCVRLAAFARQHALGYQLGCQVGETGILSAAGRHFACNITGIRYLEGSYDHFLVRESLTRENLTFKYGGRGIRLSGHGLGISVDESKVRSLAVRTEQLL